MLTLLVGALAAAPAAADIVTIMFDCLNGTWNAEDKIFTATANNTIAGGTDGHVKRVVDPIGTADFEPGFVGVTAADFNLTMKLTNISSASADVEWATLTITDANGDQLVADVSGEWLKHGSFLYFDGSLTDLWFQPAAGRDGMFDGAGPDPDGDYGSFSTDFTPSEMPFTGGITGLGFGGFPSFFGDEDFENANTLAGAQIVPAPAAVLLGILGLGAVARMRRHVG